MKKKVLILGVLLATLLQGAKADVDPNFYVYICFGQSNMEGNAQPEAIDKNNVPERFQLLATCNFQSPKRTKGNWYKAIPPLVSPAGGLGPTDWFGRTMVDKLPEVKIGVIPVAMGGSPIEMFDKDKYQQKLKDNPNEWWATLAKQHYGGNPYGRIIEMAKKAQKVGVIKGILLHQGCSNCGDPNWPNMVKKIYNDMLTDLGLAADSVPLFVGEVEYTGVGAQSGGCAGHNAVVAKIPSVIPTGYVISAKNCEGNGKDPWHFSAAGYRLLGKRYAKTALRVMGRYPLFSFETDDIVLATGATFDEKTRTFDMKKGVNAGWSYSSGADMSASKYLVVKLKEPQTADAEIRLLNKNNSIGYKLVIGESTTVVIDLHNMVYNNKTMAPAAIYKFLFRSNQAGKIVIDDIFLSDDDQYGDATAIRDLRTSVPPYLRTPESHVYTLQGVRLDADWNTLPRGLYVVGGRVVVKQ